MYTLGSDGGVRIGGVGTGIRLQRVHVSIPQCRVHSLYRSSTRGPEDDSVQSKHVAPISHYMFNITTVVFDGPSPPFKAVYASYFCVYVFCTS